MRTEPNGIEKLRQQLKDVVEQAEAYIVRKGTCSVLAHYDHLDCAGCRGNPTCEEWPLIEQCKKAHTLLKAMGASEAGQIIGELNKAIKHLDGYDFDRATQVLNGILDNALIPFLPLGPKRINTFEQFSAVAREILSGDVTPDRAGYNCILWAADKLSEYEPRRPLTSRGAMTQRRAVQSISTALLRSAVEHFSKLTETEGIRNDD